MILADTLQVARTMSSPRHHPFSCRPAGRLSALSVQCVAKSGKRAVSLAGAVSLPKRDRLEQISHAPNSASGDVRRDGQVADTDGFARGFLTAERAGYPKYVSAIARSPKIKDMPFKRMDPIADNVPSEAGPAPDSLPAGPGSSRAGATPKKQRRPLPRARAGSLRGFRPTRSVRTPATPATIAPSSPTSCDTPASVSSLLESLAAERQKGRTKLSPKLQNLCCKVIQMHAGQDLQGRSQVAKAVYLAESALLADSMANMKKLAQQLHQQNGVAYEDLTSAAMNYLRTAAKNFKPKSAASFRTYFYSCMRSQMLEAVRTQKHVLVLPGRFTKAIKAVSSAQEILRVSLGEEPTIKQLAEQTRLRPCQVEHVLAHKRSTKVSLEGSAYDEPTLHELLSGSADEPGSEARADGTYSQYAAQEMSTMLQSLMGNLTERERLVLECRFGFGNSGEPQSANATAKQLGCVRSTVLNTEARALSKLRALPEFSEFEQALAGGNLTDFMEDLV